MSVSMLDDVFLARLRAATESAWREGSGPWAPGTRWTGGIDVDALERQLQVTFPADHRRFLATLHATTPHLRVTRYRGDMPVEVEVPGFYHWQNDADAIAEARADVVDGLVFDVEHNGLWRDAWGVRPASARARARQVADLVAAAPPLFPIVGHRFVVGGTSGLVLSVHQSDIIVYGANLREYLENELGPYLHGEHRYEVEVSDTGEIAGVPFWGDLVEASTGS